MEQRGRRNDGTAECGEHGVMESWRVAGARGELRDQLCLINLPFFCPVSEL